MKNKILLFMSIFIATQSFSFDCSDIHAVSREMIEAELSGIRYQGLVSSCLNQKNFKTIKIEHEEVGDSSLLKPEYTIKKSASVTIDSESAPTEINSVSVKFSYSESSGKKIKDELVYVLNYGVNIEKQGCASILQEPIHFVMREECLK